MTKQQLKEKCKEISVMDKTKAIEFAGMLSLSDLDEKPRRFLQRALDMRLMYLRGVVSVMVECSEIKMGDL